MVNCPYQPLPYPGRLVLCLARRPTSVYSGNPARTWARLAGEGLTVHEFPGGSLDMFRP